MWSRVALGAGSISPPEGPKACKWLILSLHFDLPTPVGASGEQCPLSCHQAYLGAPAGTP